VEKLAWVFEMYDKISGPATRAASTLRRLYGGLERVGTGLGRVAGESEKASRGFSGFLVAGNAALGLATALAGALRAIASGAMNAGQAFGSFVLGQVTFHEGTMTSLNALLRSQGAGAGRQEFSRSLQLASLLPGDNNEFVASRRRLATNFQSGRERDNVFALQEDLANLNPENASQVRDSLSNVLGQIRGQDRVLGNDLLQLQSAGLARTRIFDAIASMRGLHGTQASMRNQARGLLSNGSVHGDEAIVAMIRATEGMTGSTIGTFSRNQGNSTAGMVSNLQSAPGTLMQNMMLRAGGPGGLSGLSAFNGFLREMNSLLDASSPRGQRIMAILERLINGVFGQLFQRGDATSIVDRLLDAAEALVPVIVSIVTAIRTVAGPAVQVFGEMLGPLMRALGNTGGARWFQVMLRDVGRALGIVAAAVVWVTAVFAIGLVVAISAVTNLFRALWFVLETVWTVLSTIGALVVTVLQGAWGVLTGLVTGMWDIGVAIVQGIAGGIRAGAVAVWDAISSVGSGIANSFRSFFGIASPSRLMMGYGVHISEGLAIGIERGAPRAADSLRSVMGAPGEGLATLRGVAGASGGLSLAGASVTVQLNLPEGTTGAGELAEAVAELMPTALAEAFAQLTQQASVGA